LAVEVLTHKSRWPLESKPKKIVQDQHLANPSATIRFEQAFDGFHAMVRSSRRVFYIDPMRKAQKQGNEGRYVSYFASSRPNPIRKVHCAVSSDQAKKARRSGQNRPVGRPGPEGVAFAPTGLRTYRLAIAVNSYYVSAVYDSSRLASPFDQAAKAVQATINRINGIYESELGIRLTLVPDEGKLIYVDPASDPYRTVFRNNGLRNRHLGASKLRSGLKNRRSITLIR
jgi:Metallo-peptidase family M12B Reprolysin-like